MLEQRPAGAAPAVRAVAEALPVPSGSFDVAMAMLTLQHWTDPRRGIGELRRVADRQVVLHFDPGHSFWLIDEYLPHLRGLEIGRVPTVPDVAAMLGGARVEPVLVPADCHDGFFFAYWRRPEAYLDAGVRASISYLANIPDALLRPGLGRLEADVTSGAWHDRHRELLARDEYDGGYRLLVRG
jgi:ubiquinone/menaquinone biosynthesis C-methylase UbiE